jgi:hypothetical protein
MNKWCLGFLLFFLTRIPGPAQGPGLSLSVSGTHNFTAAPNTLVKIPFSELVNNRFKTYEVLEEYAFSFQGLPGARLAAGIQWRLHPSLLLGSGLSLGYNAFILRTDFLGYRAAPGGSDTLLLPILITQAPCDAIMLPEGFDPSVNPDIRHELWQIQIPLEIRLRPGKGRLEAALGVWAALPATTKVSREQVWVDRKYRINPAGQTELDCIYNKGFVKETTGDGFNNIVWGIRGEFSYRLTPEIGIFAATQRNRSNIYDKTSRPLLAGNSIQALAPSQRMMEIGFRYLWEESAVQPPRDKLKERINQATPAHMFKKKGKSKYKKNKRRR